MSTLNIVDASISSLQAALTSRSITSVSLASLYLLRIAAYDTRGPTLNSIILLNPDVFTEAAASDTRRLAGKVLGPLDGIPYTVKDSYKVKGLTVASGSEAFRDLVAGEDAFTVRMLRDAGAVLIGKTNMPPMAAGGMQRGVYGRSESPYNADYLPAAYASGSSNGSAVSTAASFCAFSMAEETVSSGRSPASNNSLVAYTPSRGIISIRGNWPLYPTCDVIVPHTRTVEDLLTLLDVLVVEDEVVEGDFWRSQPFVKIPRPDSIRPASGTFLSLQDPESLKGKRIGVSKMHIGLQDSSPAARPVHTHPDVLKLWETAKATLESLGATIVSADFPLITNYENHGLETTMNVSGAPPDWATHERSTLLAYAWADFLAANGDINIPSAKEVNTNKIFPRSIEEIQWKYSEIANLVGYDSIFSLLSTRKPGEAVHDITGCQQALHALEAARKRDLEDWMHTFNLDFIVFPANGDVCRSDSDTKDESAKHSWLNGVKYSNGNRALRHLGVPSVTVPMGKMEGNGMPVGLTFIGRAYDDAEILLAAGAFEREAERRGQGRVVPGRMPGLENDEILLRDGRRSRKNVDEDGSKGELPVLEITHASIQPLPSPSISTASTSPSRLRIKFSGTASLPSSSPFPSYIPSPSSSSTHPPSPIHLQIHISGIIYPSIPISSHGTWSFTQEIDGPPEIEARFETKARVLRDGVMVVVIARCGEGGAGREAGVLRVLFKDGGGGGGGE
ncbi:amidase family protein [Cadophora sp. MPI-SDFR-AT-0126]|nr:amidase family protein [Leotiomycetes sp. MPI-SDFR-AT-0126]